MKLKIVATFIAVTAFANIAAADQYTRGYVRQNGTYVAPYTKTTPNNSVYDNYSTKGNSNPYTGQQGYINPYSNNTNSSYGNQTRTYNPYRR